MAAYKLILKNLLPHARIVYFHSFNHCKESKVVVFRGRKGVRKSCIAGKTTIGQAHPLPGTVVANDVHRMQITTPHRLQYCGMGLCQTDSICSPVLLFVGTDGFGAEKTSAGVFRRELDEPSKEEKQTTGQQAGTGASSNRAMLWNGADWARCYREIRRLRARIVKTDTGRQGEAFAVVAGPLV